MSTAIGHGEIPQIELPQRLLLARAYAHLNQTELAGLMGVSRKTIANAENGVKTPLTMTLRAWAYATGVDENWLQTGETPTGNDPDGGLNAGGSNSSVPNANSGSWYISRPQLRAVA